MGWFAAPVSEENAANRLTLICIDLPNIRSRANQLTKTAYNTSDETEALDLLKLAQLVDTNLQQWYRTLPSEWHYRTIGIVNEPITDPANTERWIGEQHVYHDVPLASIVNDYRVCRIFCMRVVMACVSWLAVNPKHDLTDAYENAVFAIQKMVDEISACVPFHMVSFSSLLDMFVRLLRVSRIMTFNHSPSNSARKRTLRRRSADTHLCGHYMWLPTRRPYRSYSATG